MRFLSFLLLAPLVCGATVRGDEGMWTLDNLPLKQLQQAHGFTPDAAWLKRLQLATVRFSGGTGAFVSPEGLVITNHHIGRGAIAQVSSLQRDLVKHGFVAKQRTDEIPVPAMSVSILVGMEDVTAQVRAAGAHAKNDAEAVKARRAAHERLRAEATKTSDRTFECVTLYHGGEYWIYAYKKFKDVRLVMAPENQAANFGGDDDNYTFPRFSLDFCLFRVYEEGRPHVPEAYLPFATEPLKAGDLTVISGHPGSTFRQWTVAQMKQARDFTLPWQLASQERLREALLAFGATGAEPKRLAAEPIYYLENGRKRNRARLLGLQSTAAMRKAEEAEKALRLAVAKDPQLSAKAGKSWEKIEQAMAKERALYAEYTLLDNVGSRRTAGLLGHALDLLRVHAEAGKPLDQRIPGFENDKVVRERILNETPLQKVLDGVRLANALAEASVLLGPQHPVVTTLLGGRTPQAAAEAVVGASRMDDRAFRKELLEGGPQAIAASKDPALAFARLWVPLHDSVRKRMETEVTHVINEHAARIAEARFAVFGRSIYPDATGTLRLSFGTVATYATGSGTKAQPFSTLYGLYDRYEGWGGNVAAAEGGQWVLPQSWLERRHVLDLTTPHSFVYSCDTVGGNSGSPVVNRGGQFVGINHDSIFEGQGGYYIYDPATKRAIAVDSRVIQECLRKVYDASHLVRELTGR